MNDLNTPDATHQPAHTGTGHRWRLWAVGAFLIVVLGWAGASARLLIGAKNNLQAAQRELQEVRGSGGLKLLLNGDDKKLKLADAHLYAAAANLDSPLLSIAAPLPFLGTQVRSARALTRASRQVIGVLLNTSANVSPARRSILTRLELVDLISDGGRRLEQAINGADLGPRTGLIDSLSHARATLETQLAAVRTPLARANDAMPGIQHILEGPTHLLLLAANNAEMGAGSGRPLALTTVDIAKGDIAVGSFEWSGAIKIPTGSVSLPIDLAQRWAFATPEAGIFRALVTPRFDVTAPLIAEQYQAATGKSVDGVMLVDVVALQKMVAVSEAQVSTTTATADTILSELMNGQYLTLDDKSDQENIVRQERMGTVARTVLTDLLARHEHVEVAKALVDAMGGRHVLLWSDKPDMQKTFENAGADGKIAPNSLTIALQNVGDNKLDWFARVHSDLTVAPGPNGTRLASVKVTVTCEVPDGQPRYVAGPGVPNLPYGDYQGYLTIHAPTGSKALRAVEGPTIAGGVDGGAPTLGQTVSIKRNGSTTATFEFALPADLPTMRVESTARYPSVGWTFGAKTWTDDRVETLDLTKAR